MAFGWRKRLTWILILTIAPILAFNGHRAYRALWLLLSAMGESPMAILFTILTLLYLFFKAYWECGWAGVRRLWDSYVQPSVYVVLVLWFFMFMYQFVVNAPVSLDVSLTPLSGYNSASLKAGQEITPETMRDRKQYRLVLENKTHSVFEAIKLLVQLPYPIDEKEISSSRDTGNVKFDPARAVLSFEGGSTTVTRTAISSVYELEIEPMGPGGQVQILFILNSWRDPRGKTIPPGEEVRYRIPEVGPLTTYMHGHFVADDIEEPYFAPFGLSDNGIVTLESQRAVPEKLNRVIVNFQ